MERLTYTALEQGRYDGYLLRQAPERVLQFGEGNFLRGFVEHFIDVMNERTDFQGKVVVVPPPLPERPAASTIRRALPALPAGAAQRGDGGSVPDSELYQPGGGRV